MIIDYGYVVQICWYFNTCPSFHIYLQLKIILCSKISLITTVP